MKFSLRRLLFFVAVIAIVCWLLSAAWDFQQGQVIATDRVLAGFPEIDRVWFITNDDVQLEVEWVYFTVAGNPDEIYEAQGIDHRSKAAFRADLERALREKVPVQLPSYATDHLR